MESKPSLPTTHIETLERDEKLLKHVCSGDAYSHPTSPAQQRIDLEDWAISSEFECGNIREAEQIAANELKFYIAGDCWNTEYQTNRRFWFYFMIAPKIPLEKEEQRTMNFILKNQSHNQIRQYTDGMVPVYKIESESSNWQQIPSTLSHYQVKEQSLEIGFKFTFTEQQQRVFFAFVYPYTYTDNIQMINSLEQLSISNRNVYYHRELLTLSPQNRRIDMLTITKNTPDLSSLPREELIDGLFPLHNVGKERFEFLEKVYPSLITRPRVFKDRKYIFITGRIHAAETPASAMLDSFLRTLLNTGDPVSDKLLERYVFVIVPMLNPDGVALGYGRCDTLGRDPNRLYSKPVLETEPAQYAVSELAKALGKDRRLWMYFDFHAHNNKDGAFVFGTYGQEKDKHLESEVFARLLDVYSKHFEYDECSWNHCNFESSVPPEVGKRAVMYHSKCPHSYTIESSYHKGIKDDQRYQKYTVEDLHKRYHIKACKQGLESKLTKEDLGQIDVDYYFPKTLYTLTQPHFCEVGDALRHAILEIEKQHPKSKLSGTCFEKLDAVVEFQRTLPRTKPLN